MTPSNVVSRSHTRSPKPSVERTKCAYIQAAKCSEPSAETEHALCACARWCAIDTTIQASSARQACAQDSSTMSFDVIASPPLVEMALSTVPLVADSPGRWLCPQLWIRYRPVHELSASKSEILLFAVRFDCDFVLPQTVSPN